MKRLKADLHIHTCLSACAEIDMTPRRIIDKALEKGLDIIALSDHNSAENVSIAAELARDKGIMVLPAMEITSIEEAHVLAIFETVDKALAMQEKVYAQLPDGVHDEDLLGYQLVVNEADEILNFSKKMCFSATGLSVKDLVDAIHALGGFAVASHIDREYFSVISQLGFIPDDVEFDALEISCNTGHEKAKMLFGDYASIPWIISSDAHDLNSIGKSHTVFVLEGPSFKEIALALRGEREIAWAED